MSGVEIQLQRILVAEDDFHIQDIVRRALNAEGFAVVSAANGAEALRLIRRHGLPHLAVVDIHMPVMGGLEFCRRVLNFCDLPIIMLTGVDDEEVIVRSIEQYAEDYVIKPFRPRELVARVRRVLRRIGDFGYTLAPLIHVDPHLQIDFANRKAIVANEEIILTPIETKLLYILMRNSGRIVTTEFLLNRLWPLEEAQENRLRVHVHNVRQKVECDPGQPYYIVSERGVGYRFPEQFSAAQ
ncbi:MAG: response regulator transcription factor [Anaerolineales bacterium]|nr:response regulator transcription factor [Anaerolineales bacterium]MCB8954605.1 response regulator transcription factor [Ardenticatenales bacterium]